MEFGGSLVVVVFLCTYVLTVQYSTVLLYMCSKQEHKVDHGHKKGHAPRAQEGRSPTGISRPRTEVLRTQKPRIARAPELVLNGISFVVRGGGGGGGRRFLCTYSTVVCTDLLYMCRCAVNKYTRRTTGTRRDTHHGNYKGTHSRAFQGRALRC